MLRISIACLILLCAGRNAAGCLRDQVDEKAIQWSNVIVQAKLLQVSERIEMKAVSVKPPKGSTARESSAVYWYRVYSFEVEQVIEASSHSIKPRYRIEVLRFFGKVDDPDGSMRRAAATAAEKCSNQLNREAVNRSFLLLLRPEQEMQMQKPPVWSDAKNFDPRDAEVHATRAYAPVYLRPMEKMTQGDLAHLRQTLKETRAAEKKVSDKEIRGAIDVILHAGEDIDAQPSEEALRKVGYKAVHFVKEARDRKQTPPAVKDRLEKLAIKLSPTPIPILTGDHEE